MVSILRPSTAWKTCYLPLCIACSILTLPKAHYMAARKSKAQSISSLSGLGIRRAQPINTFGIPAQYRPDGNPWNQLDYYRAAVCHNFPFEWSGMTKSQLLQYVCNDLSPSSQALPPYFEWNDWTLRVFDALTRGVRWIGITGGAGTCKTHNVIGFAVMWWLCAPAISSVTLCSTTRKMLRKRGWAEVQECYRRYPDAKKPGYMVDSEMVWRAMEGDDKHSICGRAVEEGDRNRVLQDIVGVHTDRQMLIVDEGTGVREAIFDACANLWQYPKEFIMVVIGNLNSWLGPMGRFCAPLNGIHSVTVDDEEWETEIKYDGKPGICIHFDSLKSPNILEGKVISRHLPTKEKIDAAIKKHGSERDPLFHANIRGFPPPEGVTKTVFTEPMLIEGGAFLHHEPFVQKFVVGGFDPAYSAGGDKAAVRFIRCCQSATGTWVLNVGDPLAVPLDGTAGKTITRQLVNGIRKLCDQNGCTAENLAVDATSQPSLCDDIQETWGTPLRVIGCGKAAENRNVSHTDPRTCYEAYKNKTTECWFSLMEFVRAGQVRGLDKPTGKELTERFYYGGSDQVKIQLEGKQDFKQRLDHSPDDSDALTLAVEAARIRGVRISHLGRAAEPDQKWQKKVEKYSGVYDSPAYSEPLTEETFSEACGFV